MIDDQGGKCCRFNDLLGRVPLLINLMLINLTCVGPYFSLQVRGLRHDGAKNVNEASHERVASDRDGRLLLKWVEPEVRTLEVKETMLFPGVGHDGGHSGPDCTRS
jgi:hypothetical protein